VTGVRTHPGPDDSLPEQARALIRERCDVEPAVVVVLGSGLGDAVAEDVEPCHEFAFGSIPGFPPPSVPGHAGLLVMGRLYGVPVAVFRGRVHYYEGHGIGSTTLIPRLAAALGAGALVLTNAAGGLDPSFRAGQLMLLQDHLNSLGVNPLTGWRLPDGMPAFVDLSAVYDRELRGWVDEVAAREGIELAHGVYVALPGPSYETPAESAALRQAGANAVGMSTVPEAVAGVALGLRVLGLSCITNAAGQEATHQDVLRAARGAAAQLRTLLAGILPRLSRSEAADDHDDDRRI
jgi:purine-nucleoside phosphorylase